MYLEFLQNLVLARPNRNMILMVVSCFSHSEAVEFYGMESTKKTVPFLQHSLCLVSVVIVLVF